MSAFKSIVTKPMEDHKLNNDSYNIWALEVLNALEEQDARGPLDVSMDEPIEGNTAQHRQDREAYDVWKKKNNIARVVILSAMDDYIAKQFW